MCFFLNSNKIWLANRIIIQCCTFQLLFYIKPFTSLYWTFWFNIFSHSKSHHLPWLRVGPVVTCWVHCSSNEIICPSDPPHREGDMSITGPNLIYFTLTSCGKHRVLGQESSVFVRVPFSRHDHSCNMEHSRLFNLVSVSKDMILL